MFTTDDANRLNWYIDHRDALTHEQREDMQRLFDKWEDAEWEEARLNAMYCCGAID